MRVFVTGATGFIGSALIPELISAGHQVLGLTRSEAGARALVAAGAEPHQGDLEDLESLRSGAAKADAVIHTAFVHDFSRFVEVCEIDRRAIETLGTVFKGSDRPFIVTSGAASAAVAGRISTEDDAPNDRLPRVSEQAGAAVQENGGRVLVVRLPQVHDPVKQGLVTYLIAIARQTGVSAYVGEGLNRWAAGHVRDAARLYRLVLENGVRGGRYNAVGEEGVPMREIAEAIGRGLKLPVISKTPEEANEHFGLMAMFAGADLTASSALTQQRLNWHPTGPGLIADLNEMRY